MATKNLPPAFNSQFFDPTTGEELAGGLVHTYVSGTTTPQTTWQDADGVATNTNPIVLDAAGQCRIWLDPTLVYTFTWTRADGSGARSVNNIAGSATANNIVTSVNGAVGAVVLTADDIGYTTGTSTTWFVGSDVGAALDSIIVQVDGNIPAASVKYDNTTSGLTATNVQAAIDELSPSLRAGSLLRITPFISSGTWTKGSDVGSVLVRVIGGGGGSSTSTVGSGGGGGGGAAEGFVATPAASVTVTIGAGGAAGSAGSASSFGALVAASGGAAGGTTKGGLGGAGTAGSILMSGSGGGWGANTGGLALFGHGGASPFGGGARGNLGGGAGDGAAQAGDPNSGGGGSGGTAGGASGGSGAVYVFEYAA